MYLSPSTFSILICSLPILEDLYLGFLGIKGGNGGVVIRPSTSSPLTGTLSLSLPDGMECTTRHLIGLHICTRIRRLDFTLWFRQDSQWITALIEQCSETLEYVDVADFTTGKFGSLVPPKPTPDLMEPRAFAESLSRPVESEETQRSDILP